MSIDPPLSMTIVQISLTAPLIGLMKVSLVIERAYHTKNLSLLANKTTIMIDRDLVECLDAVHISVNQVSRFNQKSRLF